MNKKTLENLHQNIEIGYNGKDSLKTALRRHGLRNKEILGLSEEFDKIILALTDKETLIHQHTFWNSNPVQ